MTPKKIVSLCAEAVGFGELKEFESGGTFVEKDHRITLYDPLHDDEQAMALVKKFGLTIRRTAPDLWMAQYPKTRRPKPKIDSIGADLNRAICECIAKIHGGR